MTEYGPNCGNSNCDPPYQSLHLHACSNDGSIDDCCQYNPAEHICMVYWFDQFLYPCYSVAPPTTAPPTTAPPTTAPPTTAPPTTGCKYQQHTGETNKMECEDGSQCNGWTDGW